LKGKAKVADLDWEDTPFHPVPIIPLSNRPKFAHIVGPSSIPRHPIGAVVVAAAAMHPLHGGRGDGRGDGGSGHGGNGGRGGDGGRGADGRGNSGGGAAQPPSPLAYKMAA
jgi:hypothetical protein